MRKYLQIVAMMTVIILLSGCGGTPVKSSIGKPEAVSLSANYLIGPGDVLDVFVWRNPEISVTIPVRPEGKISTPLVEDLLAAGKTPTQLARDIEEILSKYIKAPVVTVIVKNFVGIFNEQIRVVGQAVNPRALPYRTNMTVLDVMLEVGGLTEFAAGNRAKIIRRHNGQEVVIDVNLKDLLQEGNIAANVVMKSGDILIIPESWF